MKLEIWTTGNCSQKKKKKKRLNYSDWLHVQNCYQRWLKKQWTQLTLLYALFAAL